MQNTLFTSDNLTILTGLATESIDLIYIDPPFNSNRLYSGKIDSKASGSTFNDTWIWSVETETDLEAILKINPSLATFIESIQTSNSKSMMSYCTFMTQRIIEMHRILKDTGSLYLHCDPTASHYLKIILDYVFGKVNFKNEIVWSYNWGGRPKDCWSKKHDIILMYAKNKNKMFFDSTCVRIPYKTQIEGRKNPLIDEEKFNSGQIPTDVWDIPIIHAMSKERTGYPTQKPLALLDRIIKASCPLGGVVLDAFCGSATTLISANQLKRYWIGIDIEHKSLKLLIDRLKMYSSDSVNDFIHRTEVPQRTDLSLITLDVKAAVFKAIKDNLSKYIKTLDLNENKSIIELGADEISSIELSMDFQNMFGVSINESSIESLTLIKLVHYINNELMEKACRKSLC